LKKSGAKSVEELYKKVHASIVKDPVFAKKKAADKPKRDHKKFSLKKLTKKQKAENVAKKFKIAEAALKKKGR
jgi:hypothetical protein